MVEDASGDQPPKTSTTTGTKPTPAARHAGKLAVSLRRTHTWRAWPGVTAASDKVSCCSGDITDTSKAAWRPRLQLGRRMSAGRALEITIMSAAHCILPLKLLGENAHDCFSASLIGGVGEQMAKGIVEKGTRHTQSVL